MSDQESHRLHTLQLYRILDTETERTFDNLAKLASSICEVPISVVSFVDDKRQWFKAKVGLTITETPKDQAFCAHAIQDDKVMIVEDATRDERFANNPLVIGEPMIRFYAGAPLIVAGGERLGTLCVIDRKPRELTEMQLEALMVLRDSVVAQLELRKAADDFIAMQSLLPICAWCRNVRTEGPGGEQWMPLYEYMSGQKTVTHGICPGCRDRVGVAK